MKNSTFQMPYSYTGVCTVNDYYSLVNSIPMTYRNENNDVYDVSRAINKWCSTHSVVVTPDDFEERLEKARHTAAVWLINGGTGLSSICLCAALFDIVPDRVSIPHDPDDFKRCYNFLEQFDEEIQQYIWENVATFSAKWDAISFAWDKWCRVYLMDKQTGCSHLYEEMKKIA